MHSPVPHNLTIYDDEFDFEKNGFCPHQWEISVPQRSCVIWSVVLSYLRSADFTVPGKFEERLNRLSENVFDMESVKSAILGFNPFFNIHKCFFDETLQKVNASFRKHLNESRPSTAAKSVREDLQMISTLLKSNILIVDLSEQKLHLVTPSNGYCADVAAITLICRDYVSKDKKQFVVKRFTFSLNKDVCWELRRDAFQIILESTEVRGIAEKEIQPLTEKKEKRVNILFTLLKKDLSREIRELYDSPYTMQKLADAGFETDPMVLDENGLSAFYYALLSNEKNLMYLLHKYAANNCNESNKTFRDPDSHVLQNLFKLQKIIQDDRFKSQNFEFSGEKTEQARFGSEELELYNKFLIKMCEGIKEIRTQPKDNSAQEDSMFKKLILHILEVYDEFFTFKQLESSSTESELLENYIKHKIYYDNLDSTVSLFFFDNSFFLKRMLSPLYLRSYLELESRFVFSIIVNKYFGIDVQVLVHKHNSNASSIQNKIMGSNVVGLYIFPLVERFNLRESVRTVGRILKEKDSILLTQEDTVECKTKHDISDIMGDFPVVKDEFLVGRLHYYLSSALESDTVDLKQKFVIQRALQVLGESVEVETENLSSIKCLLRSCLHRETIFILNQLKNRLSHIKNIQLPTKFKIEQDDDLFRPIQFEIKKIKDAFEEVFDIQKYRFLEFLINHGLESIQKYLQPAIFIDDQPLVQQMESLAEVMRKINFEFLVLRLDLYLRTTLGTVLEGLKQNFVVHRTLNAIEEFMDFEKKYPSSISHLLHADLSENQLEVLTKARISLSESCKFDLNFETEKDDTLFKSIQSKIRNFKNAFDEVFDTKSVWLMEFFINRGLESENKFGQHKDIAVCSHNRKAVRKNSLEFECISAQKGTDGHQISSVPGIMKSRQQLQGFASNSEEEKIHGEIPPEIKNRAEANKKFEQDLEVGIVVDSDRFDSLFLKRKDLFSIKNIYEKYMEEKEEPIKSCKRSSLRHDIRKSPNPLSILDHIFEKKKVSESQLIFLYITKNFSDESKASLNSLFGVSKNFRGDNLENLLNRIKHLYQITIEERSDIRFLWERAKSSKAKQYLVYKIVQRYLQESSFKASLEMLLFDCVAILKNNEDFKSFCLKNSSLFNGIDWGNVLTHRDSLIESIGPILDPKDFPTELVQKMLQLFEDRECIKALIDLQQKVKRSDIISKFSPECKKLKERIVSCGRWQGYCKLLVDDAKEDKTYNDIVSFLEKSFETKWKKGKN